jgi:predicted nucleic acid-binding protein/predicted transcriptional regulator
MTQETPFSILRVMGQAYLVIGSDLKIPLVNGANGQIQASELEEEKLANVLGEEALSEVLKYLQTEEVQRELSPQAEAQRILAAQDPLNEVKKHLDNFIIGEDANKQLLFILLLSGKADRKLKQIILIGGPSGAGKSNLASLAKSFRCYEVGRLTEHALDYLDLTEYEILYLKELGFMDREGNNRDLATVKFLSTDDMGYRIVYVTRDEKGRLTTQEKVVPPITLLSTTTRIAIDSQFERRGWVLNPDETEEQTKRILAFKAKLKQQENEVILGLRQMTNADWSRQVIAEVGRLIEFHPVIIPFPESMVSLLSAKNLRVRGDIDKLYALVTLTSLIYQKKLPRIGDAIIAMPWILERALSIAYEPVITMTMQLDKRTRTLLQLMKEFKVTPDTPITPTIRGSWATRLNLSEKTIRNYLDELADKGFSRTEYQTKERVDYLLYPVNEIEAKQSSLDLENLSGNRIFPVSSRKNLVDETKRQLSRLSGKFDPVGGGLSEQLDLWLQEGHE